MIATTETLNSPKFARAKLRDRARRLLEQEIGFIANSSFRDMDAANAQLDNTPPTKKPAAATRRRNSDAPVYLEAMCSAALLTVEEERQLFCRMNYLKYRANSIRSTLSVTRPSVRKVDEIERLMRKADELRNRIVVANTRLVVSIVKKFADEKNRFDDLLSEGISCLIRAVNKFDFDRGFRFSTYATMAVQRDILRAVKKNQRDRTRFATGTFELLGQEYREHNTADQTQAALLHLSDHVTRLIKKLDDREQFIVKARCGLVDVGAKPTFSRLGEKLGVSKERVRQLELRAMNKLRALVSKHELAMPE